MEMRLQKFLAMAGVASRRASETLITQGLVTVNDVVVTELGTKVDEDVDVVMYQGRVIKMNTELVYYMLHKPVGVVTTVSDEQSRSTVLQLVPNHHRVYPVGRLDIMSSGLLLLTNDGDLTYALTHPKHAVNKTYIAKVKPKLPMERVEQLAKGGDIGPYTVGPSQILLKYEDEESQTFEIIIHEGKNRQIRKMFESIEGQVVRLKRVAVGDITLGDLPNGEYRELKKLEIQYLKSLE